MQLSTSRRQTSAVPHCLKSGPRARPGQHFRQHQAGLYGRAGEVRQSDRRQPRHRYRRCQLPRRPVRCREVAGDVLPGSRCAQVPGQAAGPSTAGRSPNQPGSCRDPAPGARKRTRSGERRELLASRGRRGYRLWRRVHPGAARRGDHFGHVGRLAARLRAGSSPGRRSRFRTGWRPRYHPPLEDGPGRDRSRALSGSPYRGQGQGVAGSGRDYLRAAISPPPSRRKCRGREGTKHRKRPTDHQTPMHGHWREGGFRSLAARRRR